MPSPSLLQRLKERKLVQWGLAYLAGAFVVFQLLDALAEPLGLTTTIQRTVLALVGIGFFIALILAWYHGEKGRQRVSGPELLLIALLLVIAGTGITLLRGGKEVGESTHTASPLSDETERPSIAVLPFDNFSPNPDDAYFADGMQDEILSKLSAISALRVISRSSVEQYREGRPAVPQIASDLGVEYVLEGSARIAGGLVRLTVQLIHGQTDEHLWSDEFDREYSVENLIDIQSGIAQEVTSQLAVVITPEEEARIEAVPTEDLEAYEAYLLGRYHLQRRDDPFGGMPEAVRYFQIALQQDPNLAVAHAALAGAFYGMIAVGVRDPRELWPQVEEWARSALAIDSTLSEAHVLLAHQRLAERWDWEGAERAIQRAIELSPSSPYNHNSYADLLLAQGRIEEGLGEGRIASTLDPLSSNTLGSQAQWAFYSRRYDEAAHLREALVTRDPGNVMAEWFLALCSLLGGHLEQLPERLLSQEPDPTNMIPTERASRALIFGLGGETDRARAEIDAAVAVSANEYVDGRSVWPVFAALGDLDEAFYWLRLGIEQQSIHNRYLGVTPLADPLRDDPRYQAILDRIGLGHLKARFDSLAATDPRGGV